MENNFENASENEVFYDGLENGCGKNGDVTDAVDDDNPLGIEEKEEESLYTIEHDGEEKSFTLDELKDNAQKGLDYDHVKEEYEKLKASPAMNIINSMAKLNNQSAYEFAADIARQRQEQAEAELIGRGVPQKEAKRLCELEAENQRQIMRREAERPFDEFVRQFPNVAAEDIDKSVWEEFEKTNDLAGAYAKFENKQLKNQIKILKQNEQNKQKSIGAAESLTSAVHDAFLEGLCE